MKCYARWTKADTDGKELFFRDHTIVQFGDSWDLIANLILLNPGSALPANMVIQNEYLSSKNLPFFIPAAEGQNYYEFSLDPLMHNMIKCFSKTHESGVIKIYNLFNLKNPASVEAINEHPHYREQPYMHTPEHEVIYGDANVIVGSGSGGFKEGLRDELKKLIKISNPDHLYSIDNIGKKLFGLVKATVDKNGLTKSYHPSYTCAYGNTMSCSL